MATATKTKCACPKCQCEVSEDKAVVKDGQFYCSEACANGHPNGEACCNSGCHCHE
ncbi:metallothionein [Oscillatoria sp. FACHB-1406]|uniref:metallothionein n=1 Tax=Oscillatoria sp. FACHB-1406 TaxID=2692846 RepID=UPI001689933F|nr:metallothionein [Oscillatoria sp. FACHB-1406]MBD2576387.1 metallothionein [Oscillatoria sp. FACHB-1406]